MKRFLRTLFLLFVIAAVFPATKASAATLAELQQKFPNGAYWNHVAGNGHYYSNYNDIGSCNNPDGYSWSPCYSHSVNAPTGCYDCNSFNGGMQCCGFARKLAFDAYGSYATNWTNYTYDTANNYMWNSLKPGDVLHYTGGNADPTYGHWVFVIAVNGNAITVGECNVYNAPCQIRWGHVIYKNDIYAQRVCVAPYALDTTGGSNVSVITWTNSLSTPWETNAKVEIRANAPYSGSWGEVGVTVWDANGSVVAQRTENAASDATTYLNIWYNITEETGAVLKPNAYYTYQFHVYFNGTRYESGIGNFTTSPCSNHTVTTISGTPATCTASGLTDGQKCSVCGLVLTEQTVIPAKGHSEVTVKGKAATCTKSGKTDGKKCSVCGTVTVAQKTIKAKGHIYTSNMDIDCNVCGAEREIAAKSVPMYRMYDPNSGEHFYTGAEAERDFLVGAGWHYEGVGFNFPQEGKPVYRLYEPVHGEHLYTMDQAEKAKLISWGWNDEGVAFNSAGTDEVPQYRLHNPNAKRGGYHFTGSEAERDFLISIGWINEGIGWYSCVD